MSKLIKLLIIINGLLIPIIIGIILFQLIKDIIPNRNYNEGIIINEKFENAKKDSLALQGITYNSPEEIYNSTNYILPISVTTYDEAKDLRQTYYMRQDMNQSFFHVMNVIFLDKNYQVINTLLDNKASISRIETPGSYRQTKEVDTTVNNIAYLIGFDDTNNDGKLNFSDNHDLYITDLDGKNLVKVTTDIDIASFEFVDSNSQILIKYKERSNIKNEYKKTKFGIFDIETSKFKRLSDLDKTINNIEKLLIK